LILENALRNKLLSGNPVLGTWQIVPSIELTEVICSSHLDFIVIDMEHGPISFETAQKMIIVCENMGVTPLVRVSSVSESEILKSLDIGAHGIHIPNIKNISEIRDIVKYSKYSPDGQRGFSPYTRAGNYNAEKSIDLIKNANSNLLNIIHLENKDCFENIDELLEIDGIDIYFIGLFDLSNSLGLPGDIENSIVLNFLKKLVKKIKSKNKSIGTISTSANFTNKLLDLGIDYITYSVDCDVIRKSYIKIIQNFNN